MFELAGRPKNDRKERNRNLGQFLAVEVTNPGQNESQQMFAFCDRVKEIVVLKNPQEEEDDRGEMIGQNPKAEVAPSSVSRNRGKEYQF